MSRAATSDYEAALSRFQAKVGGPVPTDEYGAAIARFQSRRGSQVATPNLAPASSNLALPPVPSNIDSPLGAMSYMGGVVNAVAPTQANPPADTWLGRYFAGYANALAGVPADLLRAGQAGINFLQTPSDEKYAPSVDLRQPVNQLAGIIDQGTAMTKQAMGMPGMKPGGIPEAIGSGTANLGTQVLMGAATGGGSLPLQAGTFALTGAAPVVGQTMRDASNELGAGMEGKAANEAMTAGSITALTSFFPGMAILRKVPGGDRAAMKLLAWVERNAAGRLAGAGLAEGGQEYIEGALQDIVTENYRRGKPVTRESVWAAMTDPQRAMDFAIGAGLGAGAHAMFEGGSHGERGGTNTQSQNAGTTDGRGGSGVVPGAVRSPAAPMGNPSNLVGASDVAQPTPTPAVTNVDSAGAVASPDVTDEELAAMTDEEAARVFAEQDAPPASNIPAPKTDGYSGVTNVGTFIPPEQARRVQALSQQRPVPPVSVQSQIEGGQSRDQSLQGAALSGASNQDQIEAFPPTSDASQGSASVNPLGSNPTDEYQGQNQQPRQTVIQPQLQGREQDSSRPNIQSPNAFVQPASTSAEAQAADSSQQLRQSKQQSVASQDSTPTDLAALSQKAQSPVTIADDAKLTTTEKAHRDRASKGFGRRIVYVDTKANVEGAIVGSTPTTLYVKRGLGGKRLTPVVAHEALHSMQRTNPELAGEVIDAVGRDKVLELGRKQMEQQADAGYAADADENTLLDEGLARLGEEIAASRPEVASRLLETPGLWERFKTWIQSTLNKVGITRGSQEWTAVARALDKLESEHRKAQAERAKESIKWASTQEGVKRKIDDVYNTGSAKAFRGEYDTQEALNDSESMTTRGQYSNADYFRFAGPFPKWLIEHFDGGRAELKRRGFQENHENGKAEEAFDDNEDLAWRIVEANDHVGDGKRAVGARSESLRSAMEPEAKFVAAYSDLLDGKAPKKAKQAARVAELRGGDIVRIEGVASRVVEDESGYKSLQGGAFDGLSVEGIEAIPVDEQRGWWRAESGEAEPADAPKQEAVDIPFSARSAKTSTIYAGNTEHLVVDSPSGRDLRAMWRTLPEYPNAPRGTKMVRYVLNERTDQLIVHDGRLLHDDFLRARPDVKKGWFGSGWLYADGTIHDYNNENDVLIRKGVGPRSDIRFSARKLELRGEQQQGMLNFTSGWAAPKKSKEPPISAKEKAELYPGIRQGETVSQYEKRMGTADTPVMFSVEKQKRAAAGGEYGPNGEWYSGGSFIATTDMPKRRKEEITRAKTGRVQIDIGKWDVVEPGFMSILDRLGGTFMAPNGKLNETFIENQLADGVPESYIASVRDMAIRFVAGERLVRVAEYPKIASAKDVLRMADVGIPDSLIEQLPEWAKQYATKPSKPSDVMFSAKLPDTIDVDGKQRPTTNSDGKPIARTAEEVRNFWKWFGDSKVVDKDGKPLVVYHGTSEGGFNTFDPDFGVDLNRHFVGGVYASNDPQVAATYAGNEQSGESLYPVYMRLVDPRIKNFKGSNWNEYKKKIEGKWRISDAEGNHVKGEFGSKQEAMDWLNELEDEDTTGFKFIQDDGRVATLTTRKIAERAFLDEKDGVVFHNIVDDGKYHTGKTSTVFVAFGKDSIKSATGNKGTFDAANPDIRFSARKNEGMKITDEMRAQFESAKSEGNKRKALRVLHKAMGVNLVDSSVDRDGAHSPAGPEEGSPAYDVASSVYPEDVYSANGLRYYGTGEDAMDAEALDQIRRVEGGPNRPIRVYRAVYKTESGKIKAGDWVTTVRKYAKEHGEGALQGNFKIISKVVYARDIYTAGDSWLEWGYHPQEFLPELHIGWKTKSLDEIVGVRNAISSNDADVSFSAKRERLRGDAFKEKMQDAKRAAKIEREGADAARKEHRDTIKNREKREKAFVTLVQQQQAENSQLSVQLGDASAEIQARRSAMKNMLSVITNAQRDLKRAAVNIQKAKDKAAAREAANETAARVRDAVVEIAKQLPPSLRGRMLTDVRDSVDMADLLGAQVSGKSAGGNRATQTFGALGKAADLLIRYNGREAKAEIVKMTKPRAMGKLSEKARKQIRELIGDYDRLFRQTQAPIAPASRADAAEQLVKIADDVRAIVRQHQLENKIIRWGRIADAMVVRNEVIESAKLASPELPFERKNPQLRQQPGALKRWFVHDDRRADVLMRIVDNDPTGNGPLATSIERPIRDGVDKRYELIESVTNISNEFAKDAGFEDIADLRAKASGTLGEGLQKFETVRIGGKDHRLSWGTLAKLVSSFDDVMLGERLRKGRPVTFRSRENQTPIQLTAADEQAIRDAMPAELYRVVKGMKRLRDQTFPLVQAAQRVVSGREAPSQPGYEPIITNRDQAAFAAEADPFDANFETKLIENSGFLKERVNDTTTPIIIGDFFQDFDRSIRNAADAAFLMIPLRNAREVLLKPDVGNAISERFGEEALDRIRGAVRGVVKPPPEGNPLVRTLNKLERNTKVSLTAINPGSLTIAALAPMPRVIAEIGWARTMKGVRTLGKKGVRAQMMADSPWLRSRTAGTVTNINSMLPQIEIAPVDMELDASMSERWDEVKKAARRGGQAWAKNMILAARDFKAGDFGEAGKNARQAFTRGTSSIAEQIRFQSFIDSKVAQVIWEGTREPGDTKEQHRRRAEEVALRILPRSDSFAQTAWSERINQSGLSSFAPFRSDANTAINHLTLAWKQDRKKGLQVTAGFLAAALVSALIKGSEAMLRAGLGGDDEEERWARARDAALLRLGSETVGVPFMAGAAYDLTKDAASAFGGNFGGSIAASPVTKTAGGFAKATKAIADKLSSTDPKKVDSAMTRLLDGLLQAAEGLGQATKQPGTGLVPYVRAAAKGAAE